MRFLIRTIDSRVGGSFEHRDSQISTDALTIGRATDQDIQLTEQEVALNHARITARGGRGTIKALSITSVTVNDKVVRSSSLDVGDAVTIGSSRLEVLKAPAGFDFALALERGESQDEEAKPGWQYITSLDQTGLRKRSWSWLLFLLVAVVFFAIPVVGLFSEDLQAVLRDSPVLPDDGSWESGPLTPAHRIPDLADNCNACHAKPFRMVRNEQCTACHDDMGRHVDIEAHKVPDLETARCGSCHKEHNEPASLIETKESLCTDCHSDIQGSIEGEESRLRNASNFGDDHPSFRLTFLIPETQGEKTDWQQIRVDQPPSIQEQSNLKFPHDEHLDPKGVKAPEGDVVLGCDDCHTLDARGLLMEPITMEASCRRCHTLVFNADDPEREVPHGDPDMVILALEEYYSREFLENTLEEQQVAPTESRKRIRDRRRRRPGKTLDRGQRLRILRLARDKAADVAKNIFEKTTCLTCHEISPIDNPQKLSKWHVEPVKFITQWMPLSQFNHYSHRTEDCELCHTATESAASTDVLMPDIETCRVCHGGPGSQLETSCVGCHNFHLAGRGTMN